MTYLITLGQIRSRADLSFDRWAQLIHELGYTDHTADLARQVSIGDVARSNGAADALQCLSCLPNTIEIRRWGLSMAMPSVIRVEVMMDDPRVSGCNAATMRWIGGDDTVDLAWAAAAASAAWRLADVERPAIASASAARGEAKWAAKWAAMAAEEAVAMAAEEEDTLAAEEEAYAAERARQVADIIAVSPLHALAGVAQPSKGVKS